MVDDVELKAVTVNYGSRQPVVHIKKEESIDDAVRDNVPSYQALQVGGTDNCVADNPLLAQIVWCEDELQEVGGKHRSSVVSLVR